MVYNGQWTVISRNCLGNFLRELDNIRKREFTSTNKKMQQKPRNV